MTESPKVSVLVPTYNHEPFLAQAVDSALAQRLEGPLEIVIGEDCSTDRTRAIAQQLADKHPDVIRLFCHAKNLGGQRNFATLLAACRGQYVAILEGDDYWTDPLKLARQSAALDAHPAWSACFHPARMIFEDRQKPPSLYPRDWSKAEATIDDVLRENFICTCSVLFRRGLFGPMPAWHPQITPGDWVVHILNADRGPIGFLPEVMADYRVHAHGMWSRKTLAEKHAEVLRMMSYVDHHFAGKYTRQIDDYRISLVKRLTEHCETLQRHNQWLNARTEPRSSPPPRRSPAYQFSRTVMRPLERFGKRMAAAAGIELRTR